MNTSIPAQLVLLVLLVLSFVRYPQLYSLVHAASSDIVISEIQIGGQTANDEFVELYNPTDTSTMCQDGDYQGDHQQSMAVSLI